MPACAEPGSAAALRIRRTARCREAQRESRLWPSMQRVAPPVPRNVHGKPAAQVREPCVGARLSHSEANARRRGWQQEPGPDHQPWGQETRKPVRIATRLGKQRSLSGHESRQKNTQPQNLKKSPLHEVIEITTFIYDSLSERKDTPVFSGAPDWYPSASHVRRHG